MGLLNNTVFIVRDNAVAQVAYRDLMDFVETTTRPGGVSTKRYITTDADGNWCVAVWLTWGGPEHIISRHDSEAEAQEAVEAIWVREIEDAPDLMLFCTREAAEEALVEMRGD
jgi:hypothetical protein|nr:MAG TPA: YaiA protein [Caudoviricetes sp.]